MSNTPQDRPETDPEKTAADRKVAGDGKSRPEPQSFGGANQGADPTDPDANDGVDIAADDAGASAMAERAANDIERA